MHNKPTEVNIEATYLEVERKVINLMLQHHDVVKECLDQHITEHFFDVRHRPILRGIYYEHQLSSGKRLLTDEHYRALLIEQGGKGEISIAMQVYHECMHGVPISNDKNDLDMLLRQLRSGALHRAEVLALKSLNENLLKFERSKATEMYVAELQRALEMFGSHNTRPMEPFPLQLLPPDIANWMNFAGESLGVDPTMLITFWLPTAGGAIGNSRCIAIDTDWQEPAHLWGLVICDASETKSPALNKVIAPLVILEHQAYQAFQQELSAWKAKAAASISRKDKSFADKPRTYRQLLLDDITTDATGDFLRDNPRSGVLAKDELTSWVKGLGQFKQARDASAAELGKWLSLWSYGVYKRNRRDKDDPLTFIGEKNAVLSITGAIQPEPWTSLMSSDNVDNGFDARFLVCQPPHRSIDYFKRKTIPEEAAASYLATMHRLTELQMEHGQPQTIRMSNEARERFFHLCNEIETRKLAATSKRTRARLSKLRGNCARIALVLHCVKNDASEVTLETMNQAIGIANWYQKEYERLEALHSRHTKSTNADRVYQHISRQNKPCTIREIQRGTKLKANEVKPILDTLAADNSICVTLKKGSSGPGTMLYGCNGSVNGKVSR